MTVTTSPEAITAPDERVARLGVVERVTQILDAFTDAPGRLLLEDVTRITGLPRSTAFRILGQLIDQHWVEYDAPGYRLGSRFSVFASRSNDHEDIRAAAAVALNELQLATRTVVHLSVLEGGVVHYLDKVGGAEASTIPSRVGARIVASDTVSGRALLSALSPEQVDSALSGIIRDERTWFDLPALHADLHAIRQRHGVATLAGAGRRSGISSLGVPVLGPKGPVAAISVALKAPQVPDTLAPVVLRAARCISRNLFPEWNESGRSRRVG